MLRRAVKSVVGSPTSSWEPLENRRLLTIVQPAGQDFLAFEAEHPEAVITAGSNSSNWTVISGLAADGNVTAPYGGAAIVASRNGGDANVLDTATVRYPIQLTDAGPYRMYARVKYAGGGDNSMYAPATGTDINTAPAAPPFDNLTESLGDYHWVVSQDRQYTNPTPGAPTTLTFMVRENGYVVDRIILSTNTALTAEQLDAMSPFTAHAETSRGDQLGVAVRYNNVEGATGYNVYRGTSATGPFSLLNTTGPVNELSYLDTTGTVGTTYFYQVRPVLASGEGAASNTTSAVFGAGLIGHYFDDGFWGNGDGDAGRPRNPYTGTGATATEVGGNVRVTRPGDVVEYVPQVNFNYGDPGSPNPGIPDNDHSTVFVGKIRTNEAGDYQIAGFGDDDTHVYVNGVLVSSDPGGHGIPGTDQVGVDSIDFKRTLNLAANTEYDVVVLQAEGGGGSGIFLRWTTPTNATYTDVPSANLRATNTAPAAPTGLARDTATTRGGVEIDFTDAATNELRYELQRSSGGGAFETISSASATGGINATTLNDPTAVIGQTYQYRVAAINFAGTTFSAPITVTVNTPAATAGATGYYFNNQWWGTSDAPAAEYQVFVQDGPPDVIETVPQVNFNYGNGSPNPAIRNDNHSTVFTGKLRAPETGVYTIKAYTDDDSYLWVNNVLVSADPGGHDFPTPVGGDTSGFGRITPITLTAGQEVNFVVLQSEGGGGSGVILRWTTPTGGTETVIPASAFVSNIPNAGPDQANGAPAAVTGLTVVERGSTRVALTWNDVSANELRYIVEKVSGGNTETFVLPIGSTTFVDTALTAGTSYTYRVRAENYFGDGPNATANVTALGSGEAVPTAPTNLQALPRTNNGAPSVLVSFTDNSFFEESFSVRRRGPGETTFTEIGTVPASPATGAGRGTVLSFEDLNVTAGQQYSYQVVAVNAAGESTPAGPVTVTAGSAGGTGLAGTYFDERFFTGEALNLSPQPATQNFGENGPEGLTADPGNDNPNETFSGVFEGYFQAQTTEAYTFHTASDDGIALTVIDPRNGQVLVNFDNLEALRGMPETGFSDTAGIANLEAGVRYLILGRFTENGGGAGYRFGYSTPTQPVQVIPTDLLFVPNGNEAVRQPTDARIRNGVGLEGWQFVFDDNSVAETGHEVQRATSATGPWTTVATLQADQDRYLVPQSELTSGAATYYRVRALGPSGPSEFTAPVAVTPNLGGTGINLNGSAVYQNGADNTLGTTDDFVRVTDNANDQIGSFFTSNAHDVVVAGQGTSGSNGFTTQFDFVIPEGTANPADGFAFVIQRNAPTSIGGGGGGIGYSGIGNSIAVKFDTWPTGDVNNPNGRNATGVYVNGHVDDNGTPTGLEFFQGSGYRVTMSYNADTDVVTQTITSLSNPAQTFTTTYDVGRAANDGAPALDIPAILGGEHAFVGFTGATGGANEEVRISNFTFNGVTLIPQPNAAPVVPVDAVYVSGTGWTTDFYAELAEENLGDANGYRIQPGAQGEDELPWSNINRLSVKFGGTGAVTVAQDDLAWISGNNISYAVTGFTYNPDTRVATWTFNKSFADFTSTNRQTEDKVNFALDGDTGGASIAGGDYRFRLNVVPGDANRNGNVSPTDYGSVRSGIGRNTLDEGTAPTNYTVFKDINANGNVSPTDIGVVRGNTGANITLVPDPAQPASAAGVTEDLFSNTSIL
ncbi:MAG TPA: PA14 domain-containing protein [Tepidisphaeraceae bacterium]|nr:PA14 domain-containing protein [Tepidisphaeraceae bacterium]